MGTLNIVHSYKRVRVTPGKHGVGDYRVEFNGAAPTHGELLTMLWFVFKAEDRYARGYGRRMLWWLIKEVYAADAFTLEDLQGQADGRNDA